MFEVAILGHSHVKKLKNFGLKLNVNKVRVDYYATPGTTCNKIISDDKFKKLLTQKYDIVILFLGSNDIDNNLPIDEIYSSILNIKHKIDEEVDPTIGTYILEIEPRTKPRHISETKYNKTRNNLNKKFKKKYSPLRLLTLSGYGLCKYLLTENGVHFNYEGINIISKAVENHINKLIAGIHQVQN